MGSALFDIAGGFAGAVLSVDVASCLTS